MKVMFTVLMILFLSEYSMSQIRIKQQDAITNVGKTVEVLGKSFYESSPQKDFAIISVGYSANLPKLIVHLKFKVASTFAKMTNNEFGHFIGTIKLYNGKPTLIVNKFDSVHFYKPRNEMVDSAIYYHNKHQL